MNAEILPPAVVLGLSPTGLHVVRSLGRAGVEVFGVAEGNQAGQASRYLSQVLHETDDERLIDTLLSLAGRLEQAGKPSPILISSSDQHVEFIAKYAAQLSEKFVFQESYRDGLAAKIMAKDSFYRLCDANGIRYPALRETQRADLLSLTGEIAFPWMVKPAEIHLIKQEMHGEKGWVIRSKEELSRTLPKIPANSGTLLVQEIVPGPESNITLCCAYRDAQGNVRQMFSARKLRQYPPGFGSASLVQSNAEADSIAATKNLLDAVGYRGIAASEFKRHPETGELHIIEVNVRPSLWFSISEASGRPVVLDAYRDLAGLAPLPDIAQRNGVRWRYALKDIYSMLFYRRNRDFILPPAEIEASGAKHSTTSAVFARDDWKPALAEIGFLLRKAVTRLTAKNSSADNSGRE